MRYIDFNSEVYYFLVEVINSKIYKNEFLKKDKFVSLFLRHDIDRLPKNALKMAKMEAEQGITGINYFRTKPHVFKPEIIREIAGLGHEIGYHYENMSDCGGDPEKAIEDFKHNLERLRQIVPVKSACMHGSPMSKYDNRDLWKYYDYHDYGIEFEPYFDVDFSKVFYLTDTGRRWNGVRVSVRDKVDRGDRDWPVYRTTFDIIKALEEGTFPLPAMITIHPQRWTDNPVAWTWELLSQNVKNIAKRLIAR